MNVFIKSVCFSILFGIYLADDDLLMMPFQKDSAPVQCPKNEMFKYCLNNCSTCEQRGICCQRREGTICVTACLESGCDCMPRYFRLTPGGPCEPVGKCPQPQCGKNEVFRECGPVFEQCGSLNSRSLGCDHKCYCKAGYKRNNDHVCIPEEECPKRNRCFHNEEMRESGPVYEYCMHAESEKVSDAMANKTKCYCKEGFKRNTLGHCSPENFCLKTCFNNEVYQLCPRKCNSTCRNYGDPNCEEDKECYPGCFCPEGHFMDDMRRCVTLENCPPGSNPFVPTAAPDVEVTIPESVNSSDDVQEDTTTTPSKVAPEASGKAVAAEAAADDVEGEEDKFDVEGEEDEFEDEEDMDDELSGEDIVVNTSKAPKKPPTKKPKNTPSKPKSSGRASTKGSRAKSVDIDEEEEDFGENE